MKLDIIHVILRLVAASFENEAVVDDEDKRLIKDNVEIIYAFSKHNDMAHLAGYALEKFDLISEHDKYFNDFQREQYTAVFRQENQDHELGRICNALEVCGIDFIPLKGSVLRHLYPEPWMRTSCDIDILVKKEDFPAARNCMLDKLKYKRGKESLHDESFYSDGGVHIELHFDLLEDGRVLGASKVIEDVWNNTKCVEGKKHHLMMSDEMFYFYHIAHLAKHFEGSGIGIRPFLDLYLLSKNTSNEENRNELLKKGGLELFEDTVRRLSQAWFSGNQLDELGKRAERFVFKCGTYGSEENRILLAKDKEGGGTGRYVMSRVFMPYDSIKMSYPILKKHKWLTPLFQIVRWFKLLSPRAAKSAAMEIKTSNSLSDKELIELKMLLHDVGLKNG